MSCKLIILFLFFEVIVLRVKAHRVYQNKTLLIQTTSQRNDPAIKTFVLLNPNQIQRMEAAIKNFLERLIGPVTQPITLRLSSPDGGSLQKTISEICEIIRKKIMEFAEACGLVAKIHQRKQISTITEDWFSECLLQGSLVLCDLVRIWEETWFAINHYLDMNNATLQKNEELLPRETIKSFKFLSTINDAFTFNEKLFKCLLPITDGRQQASSFDLNRAFVNLAKGPPESTVKALKTSLDRAFVRYTPSNGTFGEQLHALLCHSLVERTGNYGDCVKELRRVKACVSSTRRDSIEVMVNHTLPAKPWMTAIEDLSSCKIYINADSSASVRCNFDRRVPRTTVQRVMYIYENILGRQISRRSPLHHAANELGNVLSKSRWGRQLTYEVCQYFEIYREGRKRLNKISRQAVRDKGAATRYKALHNSLNLYKNGVLNETILVIGNFHRSALEMQKFLIRGNDRIVWKWAIFKILIKKLIKNHWKLLTMLDDFLLHFGEIVVGNLSNDTAVDDRMPIPNKVPLINMTDSASIEMSDYSNNNNRKIIHFVIHHEKDNIRKKSDDAFERLVQSMNHISRVRGAYSKSTLACLANNLLLVTMFMKTISLISTLFCLEKPKNESKTEESKEDWVSPEPTTEDYYY